MVAILELYDKHILTHIILYFMMALDLCRVPTHMNHWSHKITITIQ